MDKSILGKVRATWISSFFVVIVLINIQVKFAEISVIKPNYYENLEISPPLSLAYLKLIPPPTFLKNMTGFYLAT